tara:strand:- start:1315 stop:1608 length:294 start_codon:yes stop_codon:yes gene_type:complete
MRMTDHDAGQPCRVIPFELPARRKDRLTTSSIAAVIAVTVLHNEGESPETRLLEIIESSGEAEVLDVLDARDGFDENGHDQPAAGYAANDNSQMAVV